MPAMFEATSARILADPYTLSFTLSGSGANVD
jgi:hypothetical protein